MAVIRTQYGVVSASVTIPDTGVAVTVDLPRPADVAETNTIDWVTRPAFRKEFESGRCVITADAILAALVDVFVTKIEIMALNPGMSLTPLDLSFSQFPNPPIPGASPVLRTVLEVAAPSQFALAAAETKDLFKSLLLRTGEFVRLTLVNPVGGSGPVSGTFEARYDFGMNSGNYGSIPLLI